MSNQEVYYEFTNEQWIREWKALKGAEISVLYYIRTLNLTGYRNLDVCIAEVGQKLGINRSTVSSALKALYQKGYIDRQPIEQNSLDRKIRDHLQSQLGGLTEVTTPAGRVDLLTDSEIIEVKEVQHWKSAMGQVLAYSSFYPKHQKRIHLFGRNGETLPAHAISSCGEFDFTVTFEEVQ